ncbi:MAG: M2 family metallopeptidase, partial [Pirellulales bacterium]|nr:M2 family metallopeptidase [Pirellulales bacterium]
MRMALLVILTAGLAVMAAAIAHANDDDPAATESQKIQAKAKKFLDKYQADLARLNKEANLASWAAACSGKAADYEKTAQCVLAMREYHSDPEHYRIVCELLRDREHYDPITARALYVAKLAYEGNQLSPELLKQMVALSTEIEQQMNTFRVKFDGKEYTNNDILEMLAKENDSTKRQQYWEALKQVGEQISPKLIKLAKLRNKAARKLGYSDYWDMMIRLQEHNPEQLLAIFAELEEMTNEPFKQMKDTLDAELARRFKIEPGALMPWHYDNPFFQAAPPSEKVDLDEFYKDKTKEEIVEIARKFYAGIGLPIESILVRSDLYERPGKDQHAFCTSIDREGDVRTLLNIKPTAEWMDTMLHEQGHGVYDLYIAGSLPYNLRTQAHIFTTEAVAMLFGALAKDPGWMIANAAADPARVNEVAGAIREQRRREQLIFARWALVMLNFEKAFYENPDRDLNTLWWDHVERYQALVRPPSRSKPDWAAKPHFTCAPVYYHNYMLGELFAAQLRHKLDETSKLMSMRTSPDYTGQPYVGRVLINKVFAPGARWPWPEFVEKATGEKLTAKYFAEEV